MSSLCPEDAAGISRHPATLGHRGDDVVLFVWVSVCTALLSAKGFSRRAERVKQGSVALTPSLCTLGGPASFPEDSLRALQTSVLTTAEAGGLQPRTGVVGLLNGDVEATLRGVRVTTFQNF